MTKLMIAMLILSSSAFAGNFVKKHPRRAEVNARVHNQRERIHEGVESGKLTKEQGKEMQKEVTEIKKEERAEVKKNGGYLTKDQQKDLNHDLNTESKKIYEAKHPANAPAANAPANGTH